MQNYIYLHIYTNEEVKNFSAYPHFFYGRGSGRSFHHLKCITKWHGVGFISVGAGLSVCEEILAI